MPTRHAEACATCGANTRVCRVETLLDAWLAYAKHVAATGHLCSGSTANQLPFATESVWIAKTVLLETGWVLRSLYGFEESAISDAFHALLGLSNVSVEDEHAVARALAPGVSGISPVR